MHTHSAHILFLVIGLFRLAILPQADPMEVTTDPAAVSLYQVAYDAGVIGILAHNDLAGEVFYQLEPGDTFRLDHTAYVVQSVIHYQTLDPYTFLDLSTGAVLTGEQAIQAIYLDRAPGVVVLQTCFENNGNLTWGLTFWVAYPYTSRLPQ